MNHGQCVCMYHIYHIIYHIHIISVLSLNYTYHLITAGMPLPFFANLTADMIVAIKSARYLQNSARSIHCE